MDNRPKYLSKEQPVQCPSCGADKVAPILYGYPSSGAEAAAMAGEIVLGGCVTTDRDPSWECTGCGIQIYPEEPRIQFRSEGKGGRKGRRNGTLLRQLDPKIDKEQPLFEMQDEYSEEDGVNSITTKLVVSTASWKLACATPWFYYVKVSDNNI